MLLILSILILILIITIDNVNCYKLSKLFNNNIRTSRIYCIDNDNDDKNNNGIIQRKGKERRALRAIANRMKQDLSLLILPCSVSYNDNFIKNIKESLDSKELILLKFHDIEKKKEVKEIMIDICDKSNSEIIQVVGHTALIYKEKEKNSKIRKVLKDEIEKSKL